MDGQKVLSDGFQTIGGARMLCNMILATLAGFALFTKASIAITGSAAWVMQVCIYVSVRAVLFHGVWTRSHATFCHSEADITCNLSVAFIAHTLYSAYIYMFVHITLKIATRTTSTAAEPG